MTGKISIRSYQKMGVLEKLDLGLFDDVEPCGNLVKQSFQLTFTSANSTVEALEKGVKYVHS